ncbi:uncharacterized protein LOC122967783 isoform X1 [Thunnus albacares]|uniref:uncharacterized protein LOC121884593 isoform X1 n=1 Tax=Thunnus maccoyii TaxID=8240 RepID=UPI001C4DC329|nr:uncharacterized protein LOC121884593 isoform X1 [Thunnus maccoyii]XP_044188532.1 uncharacterized protein LOC122967783 isoform X1 [Thunnus albacares]
MFSQLSLWKDRTTVICCCDLERPLALLHGKVMNIRMKGVLVLFCMISTCRAQKWKQETSPWDPKVEPTDAKTCSNLTQVLDNWKFAILTQVKDLLINDHSSVLPEYSRIQPLSDALGDLYKQFNTLKDELGALTAKLDRVEAFVDDLKDGRSRLPQRPIQRIHPNVGLRSPMRAQMRVPDRRIITKPTPIRVRRRGQQRP